MLVDGVSLSGVLGGCSNKLDGGEGAGGASTAAAGGEARAAAASGAMAVSWIPSVIATAHGTTPLPPAFLSLPFQTSRVFISKKFIG